MRPANDNPTPFQALIVDAYCNLNSLSEVEPEAPAENNYIADVIFLRSILLIANELPTVLEPFAVRAMETLTVDAIVAAYQIDLFRNDTSAQVEAKIAQLPALSLTKLLHQPMRKYFESRPAYWTNKVFSTSSLSQTVDQLWMLFYTHIIKMVIEQMQQADDLSHHSFALLDNILQFPPKHETTFLAINHAVLSCNFVELLKRLKLFAVVYERTAYHSLADFEAAIGNPPSTSSLATHEQAMRIRRHFPRYCNEQAIRPIHQFLLQWLIDTYNHITPPASPQLIKVCRFLQLFVHLQDPLMKLKTLSLVAKIILQCNLASNHYGFFRLLCHTFSEAELQQVDDKLQTVSQTIDGAHFNAELGKGISARVCHMKSGPHLPLHVACKYAIKWKGSDKENQFRYELILLEHVTHPFIAGGFAAVEFQNAHYRFDAILLEYVAGGSLEAELLKRQARQRTFNKNEIFTVALTIATALKYIHALGVVHSDLKCDNLLLILGPRGRVDHAKLADFGLAKPAEFYPWETAALKEKNKKHPPGAFDFLPPEVMRWLVGLSYEGELNGPAADMWAYGMVLLEMLIIDKAVVSPCDTGCTNNELLAKRRKFVETFQPPPVPQLSENGAAFFAMLQAEASKRMPASLAVTTLRGVGTNIFARECNRGSATTTTCAR